MAMSSVYSAFNLRYAKQRTAYNNTCNAINTIMLLLLIHSYIRKIIASEIGRLKFYLYAVRFVLRRLFVALKFKFSLTEDIFSTSKQSAYE